MKKLFFALLLISAIGLASCHYGQEEAQKTLERNDLYKGDKAEFSVNRAGEGGKTTTVKEEAAPADTVAAPAEVKAEEATSGHGH